MSIKRILAAASASVVAVSAMAVVASAAEYESTYTIEANASDISFDTEDGGRLIQIQVGHVKAVKFTVEYTTSDGKTGYVLIGNNWSSENLVECNGVSVDGAWNGANIVFPEGVTEEGTTLKFTGEIADPAGEFETNGADCQIMVIGVNSDNIQRALIKEAAGSGDTTPDESKPEESKPEESKPEENKPNVDTGVEGVAAVVGVAAVAAGAMIVAKKRK